jgi:hypothetical protein
MTVEPRPVDELVGVYNADGGVVGELRYVAGKILGRAHCALCDITHRGVTTRAEFSQACERLPVPFVLLHLNERPDDVRDASDGAVPCVLARVGGDLVVLLGPEDLEACGKQVGEFERRLRSGAEALGLTLTP